MEHRKHTVTYLNVKASPRMNILDIMGKNVTDLIYKTHQSKLKKNNLLAQL